MSGTLQQGGGWERYAALARELDAVRAAEAARTAGIRQAAAQMSEHADSLDGRLRVQGSRLTELGRQLRLRTGKLTPAPTEPVIEPAPLLSEVAAGIDTTDRLANEAADRGRYPALLPRWSSGARNLLIYAVAAGGVLIAQFVAFYRSDLWTGDAKVGSGEGPSFIPTFILYPLVGFVVGYVTASIGGRTRLSDGRVRTSAQGGLLLCFLIGPVVLGAFIVHSLLSR